MRNVITGRVNGKLTCEVFPRARGYEVICSYVKPTGKVTFASWGKYPSKEAALYRASEAVKVMRKKNPIRHTKEGWWWGSQGPFRTREKALQVMRAIFASGYKGRNPESLYESFHGTQPVRIRKVRYEPPTKKIIKWGRISQINYIPEYPSKRRGVEYYHRFGDYGNILTFGKEKPILATDSRGEHLYIIKDKSKFKLEERGIIG